MTGRTSRTALGGAVLMLASGLVGVAAQSAPAAPADIPGTAPTAAALHHETDAAILSSGFTDKVAIGNLSEPTAVAFAPDGTAFIGAQDRRDQVVRLRRRTRAVRAVRPGDRLRRPVPVVHNYWDRGLTGIAVDPQFGTAGHTTST